MLKVELEKLKQEKESNQLKIENFDNASKSLDKLIGSQIPDKSRKGMGFPEFEGYGPKTSKSVSEDISNEVRESPDAPLVKELVSDDKERVVSGNNYTRVNYNYSAKKAHPSAHRNMVPRAVLMKTGLRSLNTARPVNTAHPKTTVYNSPVDQVNTAKGKFYTARPKAVNTARPNSTVVNAVRANQGHPQKEDQGYVDSGCSRHMTGNMSYLSDFKEFDGGYVTFGGGAKGGKITSKGTLKTGKLDFEDVYFVKELQFNLFSVSQMCDKKNSVLFTDTGCFVLSPDFKLADESQVLLKVPRKNNMCSVDMKNIVPKESLSCLVAKVTLDESILWHRRLNHVNFKTINKLVKENLVRGLLTIRFENDQTCVVCLKGKQHKASCKSKIQNSITQPLFMLHMDLFGPTFVSSLMNKKYYLVVTDDYSIFTWVFFLATKDESSGILKSFITEIQNLVDKKVKIIRCDNGTKFKNKVMSEFCEQKGIKREFSIARTPQQNSVAKRRNRTLIEAARTMLVDSKLPATFWAEAVNTACYVQNRVLVVKPHNKTPYKLLRGRTPALSFMRPFGCHVTILNTLYYLRKFDGKSDEGFFVRYSMNIKAFRVQTLMILQNASNDEPQPSSDAGKKDDDGFGVQTRRMTKITNEQGFISSVYEGKTHEDLYTCLFSCFLSQEEPKKVTQALKDPSWIKAMNKNDERGIVIRNKARLVTQGYTQEEGIDYDEVFALVARIEAIRLFLAYASFKDFVVYQMDVKSAFLYGKIE
ncbi:putative ribonuclease H-like domain-containing protein [Tanacetum coccineum]